MRLIDADTLLSDLKYGKEQWFIGSQIEQMVHDAKYDFAIDRIEEATTVDAVEIVRCKDCKWRGEIVTCPMASCEDPKYYTGYVDLTLDNGFCDRGERDDVNDE